MPTDELTEERFETVTRLDEPPSTDPLDDVFGSDEPSDHPHHDHTRASHPSDMRRLETDHTTAGYREGLTIAKASSVQGGFDEGFSVGASMGQVTGHVFGILEGIAEALRAAPNAGDPEAATSAAVVAAEKQLADAKEALTVEKLFAPEFWAADGNWKYEVTPKVEGGEVLFEDVAAQHPIVKSWTAVVDGLVKTWRVNMAVLEDESEERVDVLGAEPAVNTAASTAAPKQALDW